MAVTPNNWLHKDVKSNLLICKDWIFETRHLIRPYIRPRHGSLDVSRGIIERKFGFPANVKSFMDITKALWIGILLQEISVTFEIGVFVDNKLLGLKLDLVDLNSCSDVRTSIFFDLGKLKNSIPALNVA